MTRFAYRCGKPETQWFGNGIKVEYDGLVLTVTQEKNCFAITASRGEEFVFTVSGDTIECEIKRTASEVRTLKRP